MKKLDNWGQNIVVPTREEWTELLSTGEFRGSPLSDTTIEFAKRDLRDFASSPEVVLGLIDQPGPFNYLRMLQIGNELYRVHFEDVICEHCDKRSGMSATPDLSYVGAKRAEEAREKVLSLPVVKCVHCAGELKFRHRLWFKQH